MKCQSFEFEFSEWHEAKTICYPDQSPFHKVLQCSGVMLGNKSEICAGKGQFGSLGLIELILQRVLALRGFWDLKKKRV